MTQRHLGHLCALAGTLGILFIITFAYGFNFRIGPDGKAFYFRAWSILFVACLALLGWGIGRIHKGMETFTPPPAAAALLTAFSFLTTLYFWLPSSVAAVSGALVICVAGTLIYRRDYRACLYGLLGANFVLAIFLVMHHPLNAAGADMLPNIAVANDRLLHGLDPYEQVYSNDFFYLPVQWLIYLPFVVTGLDLRIGNFICHAAVIGFIVTAIRQGKLSPLAFMILCPLLVSRSSMEMMLAGQVWPYWLLVVALVATLLSHSSVLCAVLLGLLVATQQPAMLIAVLTGVYLVCNGRLVRALAIGSVALLVYAVVMAPWVIWRPTVLVELYVTVQHILTEKHILAPKWDWSEVSLLNLLQAAGLGSWRSAGQLLVVLGAIGAIAVARNLRVGTFLCLCGLAYLMAISLNVQVFKYYYYPGLILVGLGIAVPPRQAIPFGRSAANPDTPGPVQDDLPSSA